MYTNSIFILCKKLITGFLILLFVSKGFSQLKLQTAKTFSFSNELHFKGTPDFIYDHLTGDISAWWDHSFSKKPYKIFIEARPGGGFYEYFDSLGNGAKHAEVIYAQRGKKLRIEGPLGLSGKALQIVTTYNLEPIGADSTQLILEVNGNGAFENDVPAIVEQVWKHFLEDQFKPYIEKNF